MIGSIGTKKQTMRICSSVGFGLIGWICFAGGMAAKEIVVQNQAELRSAVANLQPQTVIKIAPGEYSGGLSVRRISQLTIEAVDPEHPPHFVGGANAWHFSGCSDLTIRNIRTSKQTGNGLNIDNGDAASQLVSGLTLDKVDIQEIGPKGNHDGIKCSGIKNFVISNCLIRGWAGQGIDCVGCHEGTIVACRLEGKEGFTASAGVQLKGGSSKITIKGCRFLRAGERPLNVGGSTGMEYFRPQGAKSEAKDIVIRDNVIEGSLCAAAFVGVDGAEFQRNTIRYPEKWIFRILQENRDPSLAPCRGVIVSENSIVFRRAQVQVEVNVGPNTQPDSFRFERNQWLAEDRPDLSKPKLPVPEIDGRWGPR